jgi:hypothetical protein
LPRISISHIKVFKFIIPVSCFLLIITFTGHISIILYCQARYWLGGSTFRRTFSRLYYA